MNVAPWRAMSEHTLPVRQVHDVLGGLARSYLFEGLTREKLRPLATTATTRTLVRGEYVCHLGDPAHDLYVIVSGEVKTSVMGADGVDLIHRLHGPRHDPRRAGILRRRTHPHRRCHRNHPVGTHPAQPP
jgi:hypothetical protein